MTLDLRTVSPVAGESAIRVRDILRRCHGAFRLDWLTKVFRYGPERASELATALETAGFVVRDRSREEELKSLMPWYTVSDRGWTVVRASAARRITRTTAQVALREFMDRVNEVNVNHRYLYLVKSAVVFGSYLENRENLGDVDVAVDLEPRIPLDKEGRWVRAFRAHAWKSGRSFSSFEEEIYWPRREVLFVLKSRKRSISIQAWFSFVEMAASPRFRFRVLLGDRSKIRKEVARNSKADEY
jgi:predicted nucleotidyltransferase